MEGKVWLMEHPEKVSGEPNPAYTDFGQEQKEFIQRVTRDLQQRQDIRLIASGIAPRFTLLANAIAMEFRDRTLRRIYSRILGDEISTQPGGSFTVLGSGLWIPKADYRGMAPEIFGHACWMLLHDIDSICKGAKVVVTCREFIECLRHGHDIQEFEEAHSGTIIELDLEHETGLVVTEGTHYKWPAA